MLNIQHVTYLQSGVSLLQDVDLQVFSNQRVGLVGMNGCGKSTLFQLIRGEVKPESGEISLQAGKTIAFVEQEIANSEQPAIEFVLDGDIELRKLEKKLASEIHDESWFEAQQRYEIINGYVARARAAQLLNGLGFANNTLENPVCSFSGGWRMRLNLASALMHRADLLLLDEPTNHLDYESVDAFVRALDVFGGAVLFVSHNEAFLRSVAQKLIVFDGEEVFYYPNTYEHFLRERGFAAEVEESSTPLETADDRKQNPVHREAKKELERIMRPLKREMERIEKEIQRLESLQKENVGNFKTAEQQGNRLKMETLGIEYQELETKLGVQWGKWNIVADQIGEVEGG